MDLLSRAFYYNKLSILDLYTPMSRSGYYYVWVYFSLLSLGSLENEK
jgi:hypothetical protein